MLEIHEFICCNLMLLLLQPQSIDNTQSPLGSMTMIGSHRTRLLSKVRCHDPIFFLI